MFFNIAGMVNFFLNPSLSQPEQFRLFICLSCDLYPALQRSVLCHLMICTESSNDLYHALWWSVLSHLVIYTSSSEVSTMTIRLFTNQSHHNRPLICGILADISCSSENPSLGFTLVLYTTHFFHNLVLCIALDTKFYGDNLLFYTFSVLLLLL